MKLQYLFLPVLLWAVVGFLFIYIVPSNLVIILLLILFFTLGLGFTLHLFAPQKVTTPLSIVVALCMIAQALHALSLINSMLILAIGLLTWLVL